MLFFLFKYFFFVFSSDMEFFSIKAKASTVSVEYKLCTMPSSIVILILSIYIAHQVHANLEINSSHEPSTSAYTHSNTDVVATSQRDSSTSTHSNTDAVTTLQRDVSTKANLKVLNTTSYAPVNISTAKE